MDLSTRGAYRSAAGGNMRKSVLSQAIQRDRSNFTILRLLLATMVVLGHFKLLVGIWPLDWPFNYPFVAVDCFFIVSGYLIASSFDRDGNLLRFFIRRIFRIYPLYVVVITTQAIILIALAPDFSAIDPKMLFRYMV